MKDLKEFWSIFTEDTKATKATAIEVGGTFFLLAAAFLVFIYLIA